MSPDERYQRDPFFRTLVDMLEHLIERCEMSGTEIREAAILALIHYEARRPPRPFVVEPGGQIRPLERDEWKG